MSHRFDNNGQMVIRDHDVVVIDNLATVPDQAKIDHSRVTFIEGGVTDLLTETFPARPASPAAIPSVPRQAGSPSIPSPSTTSST